MSSERADIRITYPVGRALVERAVALLGAQLRTTRRFHRFLMGTAVGFVLTAGLVVLKGVAQRTLVSVASDVSIILLILLFLATGALIVALLAGIPQMGIQWWVSRRLRKIGFTDAAIAQPTTWTKRALLLPGPLVASLGVFLLYGAVALLDLWLDPSFGGPFGGRNLSPSGRADALVSAGVTAGVGLSLALPHFLSRRRRSLQAMRQIRELSGRFGEALTQGGDRHEVEIRAQDLNQMASMERAEIERDREAAIARARREERRDNLVLLNTRGALEAIKHLDPHTRVLVREQAAELTQAQPAGAHWDEDSGLWQLGVPDTNVQLRYIVDNDKHELKLISVVEER